MVQLQNFFGDESPEQGYVKVSMITNHV